MKHAALPLLIGLIALTGCANRYVVTLNNGGQITTSGKPKLKDGAYYFKDSKGEEQVMPAFTVRELAPASMAEREDKHQPAQFKPEKKRKWYFLWLA